MKNASLAILSASSSSGLNRQAVTIDSEDGLFSLVREPNRYGKPTLFIRFKLGEMAPRRYGPFPELKQAKACLRAMAARLNDKMGDEFNELGAISADYGSESSGLYNIEH